MEIPKLSMPDLIKAANAEDVEEAQEEIRQLTDLYAGLILKDELTPQEELQFFIIEVQMALVHEELNPLQRIKLVEDFTPFCNMLRLYGTATREHWETAPEDVLH